MSTRNISLSPIMGALCSELPLRYSTDEFAQLLMSSTTAEGAMPPRLRNIVRRCKTAIIRFTAKMEVNTMTTNIRSFFMLGRKRESEKNVCIVKILIAVVDGFEAAYDPAHHADLTAGDVKYSGKLALPEGLFQFERRPSQYEFTHGIMKSLSRWGTNVQDALYFIKPFVANATSADSEDNDITTDVRRLWNLKHSDASSRWTGAVALSMGSLLTLEGDAYWGANGLLNKKVRDHVLPGLCFIFAISPMLCLGQSYLTGAKTLDIRDVLQSIAYHAGTLRDRVYENRAFRNMEHAILRTIGESLEQTDLAIAVMSDDIKIVSALCTDLAKPIQMEWDSMKAWVESVEVDRALQLCMNYVAGEEVSTSQID